MSEDHWNKSTLASEAGITVRTITGREYSDDDLAAVGQALLMTLGSNGFHGFLKNWQPADCPSEIVCDLLNALDDAMAALAPFSAYALQALAGLEHYTPDDRTHMCINDHRITFGDLRRAAALNGGAV